MNKKILSLLLALLVTLGFLPVLLLFITPTEGAYDLSISAADGVQKESGWTVYTNTEGTLHNLTPTGNGGYSGLDYPGQTVYFSRSLNEPLNGPILSIQASDQTFCVFLDEDLIYADDPSQTHVLGKLELPMLDHARRTPIVLSLPADSEGKTLTIAQSTSPAADDTVFPASVMLYCNNAYESSLISQTAQYLIPAALLFALGLFILLFFVWNAFCGRFNAGLFLLALTAFCLMSSLIVHIPFFELYWKKPTADISSLCFYCSATLLLGFLAYQFSGRLRRIMVGTTLLQALVVCVDTIWKEPQMAPDLLSRFSTLAAFIVTLLLALWACRNGSTFFRSFCLAVVGGGLLLLCCGGLLQLLPHTVSLRTWLMPSTRPSLLAVLLLLSFLGALSVVAIQTVQSLIHSRSETAILLAREQFARTSYENLRAQTQHTMELRHDMRKHLSVLRALLSKKEYSLAWEYLDTLAAQNQKIPSVISCGNQMLDLILNDTLSTAQRHQIRVEILHADAPPSLPLTDVELVSLVMNIMDNAIHAAQHSAPASRFLQLDLHVQEKFFVFRCVNSMSDTPPKKIARPSAVPSHGYGLKIIDRITTKAGGSHHIEQHNGQFQFTFLLPLCE